MKLGKLLGAGKSVFGGGDSQSYHEDKRVYLPKFTSEKNPFAPRPAEEPAKPLPASGSQVKPSPAPTPAPAGGATARAAEASLPVASRPVRAAGWATKLNPFRHAKPASPPMVNAVQVELSLDAVKPVTNDLADADIEVVPAKSCTVAPGETSLIPAARAAWEYPGVRMVKTV